MTDAALSQSTSAGYRASSAIGRRGVDAWFTLGRVAPSGNGDSTRLRYRYDVHVRATPGHLIDLIDAVTGTRVDSRVHLGDLSAVWVTSFISDRGDLEVQLNGRPVATAPRAP